MRGLEGNPTGQAVHKPVTGACHRLPGALRLQVLGPGTWKHHKPTRPQASGDSQTPQTHTTSAPQEPGMAALPSASTDGPVRLNPMDRGERRRWILPTRRRQGTACKSAFKPHCQGGPPPVLRRRCSRRKNSHCSGRVYFLGWSQRQEPGAWVLQTKGGATTTCRATAEPQGRRRHYPVQSHQVSCQPRESLRGQSCARCFSPGRVRRRRLPRWIQTKH